MKYLFLDASDAVETLAQTGDENGFKTKVIKTNRDFAAKITSICDEMLNEAGWSMSDVDTLVLGTGPGSLTGLRVAAAFMRAVAVLHNVPLFGLNRFLWAFETLKESGVSGSVELVMPTLIDKAFLAEAELPSLEFSNPGLIERNKIPNNGKPVYGIGIHNEQVKAVKPSFDALHKLIITSDPAVQKAHGLNEILKILPMYVIPSQAERNFKFNKEDKK